MFSKIMVPVDLRGGEIVDRALDVAVDLAKLYGAEIVLVSLTSQVVDAPNAGAESAHEKLSRLAEQVAERAGTSAIAHNIFSPDVAAELDAILLEAVKDTGADLVVVGSHIPGFMEYLFSSHAGNLAAHAKTSVFVVR